MNKAVWISSESRFKEVPMCENGARNTDVNYGHGIGVTPQCYDNPAEFEVIVDYGCEVSPPMKVCGECLSKLRKDARRYGYKLQSTRLDVVLR